MISRAALRLVWFGVRQGNASARGKRRTHSEAKQTEAGFIPHPPLLRLLPSSSSAAARIKVPLPSRPSSTALQSPFPAARVRFLDLLQSSSSSTEAQRIRLLGKIPLLPAGSVSSWLAVSERFGAPPRIVVGVGVVTSETRCVEEEATEGRRMGGPWAEEGMPPSNLQCFLDCTTPTVETHILPKANGRLPTDAWHHAEMDSSVEYFNLADLWEQYYEWSAYGAGATVQLPGGERVVQYYVPYLSGMQLYTNKALTASRSFGEDNGDFWSDDDDNEKMSRSWSSTSDESLFNCDVLWSNRKRPGHLYFEFFEVGSPYGRVPLIDKVYELSQGFPGLTSLKSSDLSPVSWMSVAWYPIYHIPYQRSVKDLSACFLTYHTISSSFQDHGLETMTNDCCHPVANGKQNGHMDKKSNTVSLPPFGLAAHKIQGSLWTNPMTGDNIKMNVLFGAADSWLKQLGVQHHDFNFFITHPM